MGLCAHILLPVSMIRRPITRVLRHLRGHGGDPDGREAHSLDIIQLCILFTFVLANPILLAGLFGIVVLTWLMMPCHEPPQYFCIFGNVNGFFSASGDGLRVNHLYIPERWCHRRRSWSCQFCRIGRSARNRLIVSASELARRRWPVMRATLCRRDRRTRASY
jgi:hypothetical protein